MVTLDLARKAAAIRKPDSSRRRRDFYFKLSSRPLCAYLEIPAMIFFENGWRVFGRIQAGARPRHSSHGVLESRLTWMSPEASLRAWMPAIHAGMTASDFSLSMGECKLMNHFVEVEGK